MDLLKASRQGLATRALRLTSAYAFSHLAAQSLEAHIALDNIASRAVARNAGFTQLDSYADDQGQPMVRHVRTPSPPPSTSTSP